MIGDIFLQGQLTDFYSFFHIEGKDRFPGLQDREKLSYTEATLHESMRLNPAVTIGVPHSTMCDTSVGT